MCVGLCVGVCVSVCVSVWGGGGVSVCACVRAYSSVSVCEFRIHSIAHTHVPPQYNTCDRTKLHKWTFVGISLLEVLVISGQPSSYNRPPFFDHYFLGQTQPGLNVDLGGMLTWVER